MPRPIKILSDFDGVWTNQGPEAQILLDWMVGALADLAGVPRSQADEELGSLRVQMRAAPGENGWAPDGRISAYIDEDPLVESSALCRTLANAACELSARYKQATLAGGFATMADFSEHAFRTATAEARDKHPPCIVPNAGELLEAIRSAGADVVIISNSGSDKIANWFQSAGVEAGEGEGHNLRLRGSAMKWFLGETDDSIQIGGRRIFVDRPHYKEAILAENPDLIIGDVFSLDLALPHVMRSRGVAQAPSRLALRRHPHSPSWVVEARADGAVDHIVDSVGDLPAIVREMAKTVES